MTLDLDRQAGDDIPVIGEIDGGRWKRIRDIVTTAERDRRPLTLIELGNIWRDARALAGITLGDMSRMLKTAPTALSDVELGKTCRVVKETAP